ncbi:hypothetical protein E4G14_18235 [Salmonella enterica]|nr:hypothetical protein [Salmonella enterica]EBQ6116286.1 hypothetical protein [Salmonella enterica subsp. enterica serovar Praha]EEE4229211.1 hypothetical protein [Salmonella enterica subsp. enterica serovar Litchfield]EAP8713918.1 hypothetical protein [Salmonella enterica]EAV4802866.1 hypothetical protein [Salmonella enterica]
MESMAEGMIKDLVASGHALADDMTGAPSVLIRCLAAQLEVQLVRANALAAENAGLKAAKEIIRHLNVNREEANFCGIDDCYIDDAVAAMITPVTDAFLAEVRAQGVEMLSEKFGGGTLISDMVKEVAKDFASQLRKGAVL